jgi:HTH-type transcriptional regulator / antitoxin HigA
MNKLIKTPEDHAKAIQRISLLMDRDPEPATRAADELELLVHLAQEYEKRIHPIGLPDPISAIRFRMEQQGLNRGDLVPFIGPLNRVSEVLSGKRRLSLEMMRRLHRGLGIPAEVLLGKFKVRKQTVRQVPPVNKPQRVAAPAGHL